MKGYYENRFGGELQWEAANLGSTEVYGEFIETRRWEALGNYEFGGRERFRAQYSFSHHFQDSYYGDTRYQGRQDIGFVNVFWNKLIGQRHQLLVGASTRAQYYDDNTTATDEAELDFVPGIYLEDEIELHPNLHFLAGTRLDYHEDHGGILAPRANLRWKPGVYSTFRLTGGTGFRNVNLFTEDHAFLTGSRTVVIAEDLDPERSISFNMNYHQVLNLGNSAATLDADLFYTRFSNKIIPDYDFDPNYILYQNLDGIAYIRGAALSFSQSFAFPLYVAAGFTLMDVYSLSPTGERESQEFAPVASGVFNIRYSWKPWKLSLSYRGKVVGPMDLPTYEAPNERPERSGWFTVQDISLVKSFTNGVSLQLGVRNLLNYTQESPLIDPANPFGDNFDTAYSYGPLQSRRFIFGTVFKF